MKRHYLISDDLERIEEELELRGIHKPQIHALSKDDAAVTKPQRLHK